MRADKQQRKGCPDCTAGNSHHMGSCSTDGCAGLVRCEGAERWPGGTKQRQCDPQVVEQMLITVAWSADPDMPSHL